MTFGYGRIEIVAALINYTALILFGFNHSTLEVEREDRAHQNADLYCHGAGRGWQEDDRDTL